ncbi:LacI family DNA-binding transcriptional regulator [Anaerocolumna sp. AGMB13025]|uniref:LacI family DNA-binding transcriptional regulator n=1 Tax=Anaerocolumna sp. AGMB13025 TaxID=3039116 RepID=UPI00241C7578|nr:LacI family DNA-binding transcriptional regulator [Anaerocolumna sp. AGMB13025]WFR54875.1 LacI family DNA-binding transcriptional regulator [Anaerocolumna sp. AGMB13025]
MSISAKELAEKLNISPATVSMVLNNKPGISEQTRKIVMDAAAEFGFQSSKKQLQKSKNRTIQFVIYKKYGTVVSDTPFFSQVTEGINYQCSQNGYHLQITYLYDNEDRNQQLEDLKNTSCDGILLLGTEMTPKDYQYFQNLKIPFVILDSYFDEINCDAVLINNAQGSYLATQFLTTKGHKQIGYLRSNIRISNFVEREDGYYKSLRHNNIPTSHPYVVNITPTTEQAYLDICNYLKNKPDLPTAFFADNDIIGAAAIRAFKEFGITVPEQVSIIGFDDMPICQFTDPTLTTMYVPKQRLGALAVDRLLSCINDGNTEHIKIELAVQLMERNSVKEV